MSLYYLLYDLVATPSTCPRKTFSRLIGRLFMRYNVLALRKVAFTLFAVAQFAFGADTYKVLHWFSGTNGNQPRGLIFDSSGNLYGTTALGGKYNFGTVFELSPNSDGGWREHILHNFCSQTDCADGRGPVGLVFDSAGNLYGIVGTPGNGNSAAMIFRLSPGQNGEWTEKILYTFCSEACPSGYGPSIPLAIDASGALYGTTVEGGANNAGVAFKLAPGPNDTWIESVLYNFCSLSGCPDGEYPLGGMVFDAFGNLYGTTSSGGVSCPLNRRRTLTCGTVFELTPGQNGTWMEQVIVSFNKFDGATPLTGVVFDAHGNLYGTTEAGGEWDDGVVFELTPGQGGAWTESILRAFSNQNVIAYNPPSFDPAGNLYETAVGGGIYAQGIVFEMSPGPNGIWTYSVIHSFNPQSGDEPAASVISDVDGNLYGTAGIGGLGGGEGDGTVFEITP
jgi:uncharacterized repeat protein (TIGR03803 family)